MGTGLRGVVYEDGKALYMEDFTQCMTDYIMASDPSSGLYPLNDDLIYMIQISGAYMGWWDASNPNFLLANVEGLNPESGWMFAVCAVG